MPVRVFGVYIDFLKSCKRERERERERDARWGFAAAEGFFPPGSARHLRRLGLADSRNIQGP